MYRGEGNERKLASLSAPVVMSLSKTSLIFNGAQLQEKGEERRARNLHAPNTHMQTEQHIRASCTFKKYSKLQAHKERTHTCIWILSKQGSVRLNGVESHGL